MNMIILSFEVKSYSAHITPFAPFEGAGAPKIKTVRTYIPSTSPTPWVHVRWGKCEFGTGVKSQAPPSRVAVSPGSAPRTGQFPVREHGWYRSRSIVRVVHVRKRVRMPVEGAEPCLNRWRRRAVSISWQNSRFPPK